MVDRYSPSDRLPSWNHVGVYVGGNKVVHFVSTSRAVQPLAITQPLSFLPAWLTYGHLGQVERVNLDEFIGSNEYVYRVIYKDKVYEAQTIVKHALAALKPNYYRFTGYSILSNNSKHFASYVSTTKRGMFYVRHQHIG